MKLVPGWFNKPINPRTTLVPWKYPICNTWRRSQWGKPIRPLSRCCHRRCPGKLAESWNIHGSVKRSSCKMSSLSFALVFQSTGPLLALLSLGKASVGVTFFFFSTQDLWNKIGASARHLPFQPLGVSPVNRTQQLLGKYSNNSRREHSQA